MTISEIQEKLHSGQCQSLAGETFSTSYIVNDYVFRQDSYEACIGEEAVATNLEQLHCIDVKWRILGANMYRPVYTRYSNADSTIVLYEKNRQVYQRRWNDTLHKYDYEVCNIGIQDLHENNDSVTAQTEQVLITSNEPSTFSLQGVFSKFSSDYLQSTVRAWLNSFDCRAFFVRDRKQYAANSFLVKHLKDTLFLKALCPVYVNGNQWDYVSLPSLRDIGFSAEDVNNHCVDIQLRKKVVSLQFGLDSSMCWMFRDSIDGKIATVREDGMLELNSLEDYDNIAPICTIQ